MRSDLAEARDAVRNARKVVFLTGAGVSQESGIPTFRDPDGLWAGYDASDLATPEGFERDPRRVWEWYSLRRQAMLECSPNPGHQAIARFLEDRPESILVTQNVDGLHHRALADREAEARVLELHGNLLRSRCCRCDAREGAGESVDASSLDSLPRCTSCDALLRPDVVWFGELLDERILERSFEAARQADVCVVAGTSAVVHPAASVPLATIEAGGAVIEVNPEETPLSRLSRWSLRGTSGTVLPDLLAQS